MCVQTFFFVKFSEELLTIHRIFKFGTTVGFDLLYCVKESQPPPAKLSLYLSIFLSLQLNFLSQVSRLL